MNKFNYVKNGEIRKLPPGFRFQPTDEEIVFQYLTRKIFSFPLPAFVIPEIHTTFTLDPWELPGNLNEDRYFYANKELNQHGVIRGSRGGYWKCVGSDRLIRKPVVVGIKKTLVFHERKHTPTDWIMHLYCLALHAPQTKGSFVQIGKWVLCHVFLKRSVVKDGRQQIKYEGFLRADELDSSFTTSSSTSSSDSDSSVLSEVSSADTEN